MRYDPNIHHRRSIRLQSWDYSWPGAYFVTICTKGRTCTFGDVVNGEMNLSVAGEVILQEWEALPLRFPSIELDAFAIMPKHVHAVIIVGAQFIAPSSSTPSSDECQGADTKGAMNRAPTLGEIIRSFKAASARRIRRDSVSTFAWQRNYYEHVVRTEEELFSIRSYIEANPQRWAMDRENPDAETADPAQRWEA